MDPSDCLSAPQKGTGASYVTPAFLIQFAIFQTQKKRIMKETGRTHRHRDHAEALRSFNDLNLPGAQSLVLSAPGGRGVWTECLSCQKTSPRQERQVKGNDAKSQTPPEWTQSQAEAPSWDSDDVNHENGAKGNFRMSSPGASTG